MTTAMTMLFGGLLPVHSTCRDCHQGMLVTNACVHVHPNCTEHKTRLETLLVGWVSCVMAGNYESAELTDKEIQQITSEPPDLCSAAIEYAGWGWPVFPLKAGCGITNCRHCTPLSPCGKKPAVPKSIGGQGFKDAKTDVNRIGRWWQRHLAHNIGLATGHRFDVIDIDPKHGGVQSFLKLLQDKDLPDCHGIAVTASGGMHLYVKPTGKGNFANLRPGIDYRGRGGYVVAPPSTLGQPGRDYGWLTDPSPEIKGGT
jgi:Bifunctional DNA primase/polymerase, N-terminal